MLEACFEHLHQSADRFLDGCRMWHHRPIHAFEPDVFYMVTAGTLHKQHFYQGSDRLELLQTTLQDILAEFHWTLQAWAVFSNHYHFIAKAPTDASSLKRAILTYEKELFGSPQLR